MEIKQIIPLKVERVLVLIGDEEKDFYRFDDGSWWDDFDLTFHKN